ncbi:hypothetical protein [Wielerella bovis]|nr:hypothetical protein [Wielerella bovis]
MSHKETKQLQMMQYRMMLENLTQQPENLQQLESVFIKMIKYFYD